MSDADGEYPAEEIEVFIAFDIPEVLHGCVVGHEWFAVVVRDRRPDKLLVLADNLFAASCRHLGRGGHFVCSLPVV